MKHFILLAGVFLLFGLGCSKSATPPSLAPCSAEGQSRIALQNRLSMPAGDNIFEADPADLAYSERNLTDIKRRPFADPNTHGDQCRAVLGPLPVISCPDSPVVQVTHNGHVMTYENGKYLEDGKPTTWRPIDGCDRPGHIGLLFSKYPGNNAAEGCSPNVRLGGVQKGNVYWAWVCHNNHGEHEKHDPFDFVTVIGANMETGETCFIGHDVDGNPDPSKHVVAKNVVPPGGIHPGNAKEREEAKVFWEPGHMFVCLDCHGANGPFLTTPNANQKRLLGDGSNELFPRYPTHLRMKPGSGFRVIGTGHNVFPTNIPLEEQRRPKAIVPMTDDGKPDRTCTRCHQLTDQEHYLRLARLSVGMEDYYYKPRKERPWMPLGINAGNPIEVKNAQEAVARYERAWRDPKWRFSEKSLLSECPAPAAIGANAISTRMESNGIGVVSWKYVNDYGEVPLRDDVRFQVRIDGSDGSSCVVRDLAPKALGSADWQLSHPTVAGVTYQYKVRPYRYCFDRKPFAYACETGVTGRVRRN